MEKKSYAVKITEIDNGYRFEVTGGSIMDMLKPIIDKCCKDKGCCETITQACCPDKE